MVEARRHLLGHHPLRVFEHGAVFVLLQELSRVIGCEAIAIILLPVHALASIVPRWRRACGHRAPRRGTRAS